MVSGIPQNQLTPCRQSIGKQIKRHDASRIIIVEEIPVMFTPTEYRLLVYLLDQDIAKDELLIQALRVTNIDKSTLKPVLRNLEKHIDNIKSKLRPIGLYIRRVHQYGFALVPDHTNKQEHTPNEP